MGWAVGFDPNWKRDVGYGVPSVCDHPGCKMDIDRGLGWICGWGHPGGGEAGCGLFFCGDHGGGMLCERCEQTPVMEPFEPTEDTPEWMAHKLEDPTWQAWRDANPAEVARLSRLVTPKES